MAAELPAASGPAASGPDSPGSGGSRGVASAPVPRVRAVARVPVRFLPVPPGRGTSRLRVGQLVALQLAVLSVAAGLAGPRWALGLAGAVALVVVALACGRRHGRWWYEVGGLRRRLRARRRATRQAFATPMLADPRLAALAPSLSLREVELRGSRFGVGLDDAGWYAAFAIVPPPGPEAERRLVEAVDRLGEILVATDAVSALQLVHHTVPAPTPVTPAGQWLWVAVRLAAADAAAAAASRGGGVNGVHRALATAVGRVQKTLRAAGLAYYRVLSAEELAGAVAAVGGFGSAGRSVAAVPGERWHAWYGPDAPHVCFRLSGSPQYSLSHLVAGLSYAAVHSFTVSVLLHPQRAGGLGVDALLRVAVAGPTVDSTVAEVTGLAGRLGLELTRLDGEHAPAVYAAAPTGRPVGGG